MLTPAPAQLAFASLAAAISAIGVGLWVPRVVDDYGQRYFDRAPWAPAPTLRVGATALTLLATAVLGHGMPPAAWPFLAGIVVALTGVVAVDGRFQVIPDRIQACGLVASLGFALATSMPSVACSRALAGLLVAGALWATTALYERLRARSALGFGDLKLLAWLGIALGPSTALVLLYALLAAAGIMLPLTLVKRRGLTEAFAFGPFLVGGVVMHCIVLATAVCC